MRPTNGGYAKGWHALGGKSPGDFPAPHGNWWRVDFDLWDGDRFIGKLATKTLIEEEVEAGEHYFMAKAANWSVVMADLKPGQRYYVLARPAVSATEIAVVLEPATLDGKASELTGWLSRLPTRSADPELALKHQGYHAREARGVRRKARVGEIFVRILE